MNIDQKKQELKELFQRLVECVDEDEQSEIVMEIAQISPDPYHVDYIYQTDEYCDKDGNIDYDAVVDKIFSYRAISL